MFVRTITSIIFLPSSKDSSCFLLYSQSLVNKVVLANNGANKRFWLTVLQVQRQIMFESCPSFLYYCFIVSKDICWAITISVGIYKWTLSFLVGRMLIFFLLLKMGRVIQINHPVCSSLFTFPSSTHMRRKRSSGESFEESGETAMEKRSRGDRGNRSDQILVVWLEVNL